MARTVAEKIDDFLDAQFASTDAQFATLTRIGENFRIYERRLNYHPSNNFNYTPYWVYFYYINITSKGELLVKHYLYSEKSGGKLQPIPHEKKRLEDISRDIAASARLPDGDPRIKYTPIGYNFKDVVWTKKSHIIFFFDESGWEFHRSRSQTSPVTFSEATPNHSFFDALDLNEEKIEPWTAVSLINHMKRDDDGNDLKGPEVPEHDPMRRQYYKFTMVLDVSYVDATASRMIVSMDPGGENQGPPDEP